MSNELINRQYVGARYVPKIMGEWNKALQYEALSVVTYMGNSFTSKVPVPANSVDINNTDYWINTGNYNSQVETYRNETKALADKVNDLPTKKRYILMADSYGVYTSGGTTYSWTEFVINALQLTLNNNVYNLSMGSRGFCYNPTVGTFLQGLENAYSSITDKKTITDIFVCGGTNDTVGLFRKEITITELNNAIEEFANYCKKNYPNAIIHIGYNGVNIGGDYYPKYMAVINAYKNSTKYGCSYINNLEYVLSDLKYNDNSGIHPTPQGFNELNKQMVNALLNYDIEVHSPNFIQPQFEVIEGVTLNANTFKFVQNNDLLTLSNSVTGIVFSLTNVTLKDDLEVKLAKLKTTPLYTITAHPLILCDIKVGYVQNNYIPINACLEARYENGYMYIYLKCYKQFTNENINKPLLNITVPLFTNTINIHGSDITL